MKTYDGMVYGLYLFPRVFFVKSEEDYIYDITNINKNISDIKKYHKGQYNLIMEEYQFNR